ncbi:MAG TPA: SpoIIE family protein phosphatase [Anaerolineae bacterium]|nr:SpoIIE family protein phosphatase [Anaerolineae bacterium]HID85463.1 hypothetical protein [Anaerolineales bacterium]HIQ08042.1 hypothetical protein [Anaerolineaceae bacterium]
MPKITAYYRSDTGRKRENNEDAVGGHAPRNAREARQSGWLYVVADGLGGHQFGERASQHAVKTLLEGYCASPDESPPERLRRLIQQANAEIYQEARRTLEDNQSMATTIVAAAIHQGTLYLAHVGDSRAYLIRGERIYRLTRDHSVVEEMVRSGAMTPEEARTSKLRNRLTRSVGTRPKVEVELSKPIPLQPGDLTLLCSDGLTQYADDEDILAAAYGEPRDIVERLIDFANARGGSDNVTVAAISYGGSTALAHRPRADRIALAVGTVGVFLAAGLALAAQAGWWPLARRTATPSPTPILTQPPPSTIPLSPGAFPLNTPSSSPAFTAMPTTASPSPSAEETGSPEVSPPAPESTLSLPDLCLYHIQEGDDVESIAQRFGIPVEEVLTAHQGTATSLETGETLRLSGLTAEQCATGGGVVVTATPTPSATPPPTSTSTLSPTATRTLSPTPTTTFTVAPSSSPSTLTTMSSSGGN